MVRRSETQPRGDRSNFEKHLGHQPEIRSLADVQKNYELEVREIEQACGPQVPALLVGSGRPRKGQEPGEIQVKALKMPTLFWMQLARKAEAQGLSLHAAMRIAQVEWAGRH